MSLTVKETKGGGSAPIEPGAYPVFTIPSDDTIESCTITEEAVDGSGVPMIDRK